MICKKCHKDLRRYIEKANYCQMCYREMLREYSFYEYDREDERIKGNKEKILKMLIEEGIEREKIHEKLGLNRTYVQQVIRKYAYRCNSKGEKRPF